MHNFKTIALIGGSGSGKTALSISLAKKLNCVILSLDSLSVYKEINIASAKPSKKERDGILHFGIDILSPQEPQNVQNFIDEFLRAKTHCKENAKNLLIVGGSGFYLKTLLNGISNLPEINKQKLESSLNKFATTQEKFAFLSRIDASFAATLAPTDSYRITKALEIYFSTNKIPSLYFKENPPTPILQNCPIFEILLPREILRERIRRRTLQMLENGLISEVQSLKEKYGLNHQWAKSIGIKETLAFLSGEIPTKDNLSELITIHTAQLTKRQRTFNKTQFPPHFCGNVPEVEKEILGFHAVK